MMKILFVVLALPVLAHAQDVDIKKQAREYSDAEVRLLQELEMRRTELDRREQAVDLRERLVDLAEVRLMEHTEKMQTLQDELAGLLKNLSDKEDGELEQLAKIYESMKPASAASVLDRLDNNIVFDLFKRMKSKSTAKIMEKMSTGKARIISEMLAEKEDFPAYIE